jgi:hypothetical protein
VRRHLPADGWTAFAMCWYILLSKFAHLKFVGIDQKVQPQTRQPASLVFDVTISVRENIN